jgi:hypothetical protein
MTMTESICEEVRRRLALGDTEAAEEHLATCEACALEARRLKGVLRLLARDATVEPGAELDRQVRRMLVAPRPGERWALRPVLATGLATASALALVLALAATFAEAGAGELGFGLALTAIGIYFAMSLAASLPLLLLGKLRTSAVNGEVRS